MSKKKNFNQKTNIKKVAAGIVILLVVVALSAGMGALIYKEASRKDNAGSAAQGDEKAEKADQLADGEVYDFEEAGYIKLGTYKGLTADVQADEEDVFAEMIAVAEESGDSKKNAVAADGDLVNIDYTAKLDGVELEDASEEDAYVWVGKGEYISDFEKGIIGIEKGKKKTVDCTFPSDYDDEDLAGKTVQFTIKVYEIFTDKTADKASDGKYKTVQEYYDYEKAAQLEENKNNKGELVWDALRDEVKVNSAPENMLARAKQDITTMYTSFAELSGMTVEELLAQFGMDENGIEDIANDTVIDIMVAKTIAAKENITMDDSYYQKALMTMLGIEETDDEAKSLEELEKEYKESQGSRPKDDMLVERVRDFVGENAKEGTAGQVDEEQINEE